MADKPKSREERFTGIYAEYYPLVYNAVYSKVGNRHDADDICQEVFLITYEKLDNVYSVRNWLYSTLKNAVLRYYERNKRPVEDIEKVFDDIGLTYINGFKDIRIIITDAIEKLDFSEEERLILEYIAFYGYSYAETGKIMGLTKRQVGYKYVNIVDRILEKLKEQGIENIEDIL